MPVPMRKAVAVSPDMRDTQGVENMVRDMQALREEVDALRASVTRDAGAHGPSMGWTSTAIAALALLLALVAMVRH